MKTNSIILKLFYASCCIFTATAAFSQTAYIWNGAGTLGANTNIDLATNYVGGTLPNAGSSDTAEFDGVQAGDLDLNYVGNWQSGPGSSGVNIYMTANQTGALTIENKTANANPPNIAIYGVNIDSGAGVFTLGNNNILMNFAARPSGATHYYVNNSTHVATINSQVRYVAGGGSAYTMAFGGTGDWQVNNYLQSDNGAGGVTFEVDGPGTTTWSPGGYAGSDSIVGIVINNGTLVLKAPHPKIVSRTLANNYGAFVFDVSSQSQLLSGVISGYGMFQVNSGTLTFSGANTYGGTNLLTGGELIVNGTEDPGGTFGPLGVGSIISFAGGTLGFSVNNTFDYSSRFDTADNQAYSIDTAGQNVIFTNDLASSGGTFVKLGAGTLTLAGTSRYTGATTVRAGRLLFQGEMTGTGNVTVLDGAAFAVTANGTQVKPAVLTVGSVSGGTLGFYNINSTTTAPIAAGTLAAVGPITINVNSGTFTPGQSYPLLTWASGPVPEVALGVLNGYVGNLSFSGNTLILNVTATDYQWTGASSGIWDTSTLGNWIQGGVPVTFANGGPALFDDTSSRTNVTISGVIQPTDVTFNNDNNAYALVSSAGNGIGGSSSLTMGGNGTLTLTGGANTYTGVTTISAGTVSVGALANGGSASDLGAAGNDPTNLVLNGGKLQYTGPGTSSDRLFTLGLANGTIDASGTGGLSLNNSGSLGYRASGPRALTLTGSAVGNLLAAAIGDNGDATALTKSGAGSWILAGTNTYSGKTTINGGLLVVGAGGESGSLGSGAIVNNGSMDFNRAGTLTVSGGIGGTGSVTNDGAGTVILDGNNTYAGGTTINAGTLQLGTGGASGAINGNSFIVNNGTLVFNTTTPITISGYLNDISGTGNVVVRAGFVQSIDNNTYTGWTEIDSGATFQPSQGQTGGMLTSVITNNGVLKIGSQNIPATFGISNNIVGAGQVFVDIYNQNAGWVVLAGTNSYTGGTYIGGGGLVIGDGVNPNAGSIIGNIVFTNTTGSSIDTFSQNKRVIFNRPDNFTFTNVIISAVSDGSSAANSGSIEQSGPGMVTLTGNNSFPGGTTIDAGMALQVGDGGTSGSIGNGNVVNGGTLIFDHSDNVTFGGSIGDNNGSPGALVQSGSGTLTLTGMLTNSGPTTVSNGTLVVTGQPTPGTVSFGGDLNLAGGTLIPGAAGTAVANLVQGNMNINSGTIVFTLNKSAAVSNTVFTVTNATYSYAGSINITGGTLKLNNAGPALNVGDKFTLFTLGYDGQITGAGNLTFVTPGFTVNTDNLSVDGSVTVTSVTAVTPPTITATIADGSLNLSWPAASIGAQLQVQTNSLATGLGTNWVSIPGTETGNSYSAPLNKTSGSVFYRLVQ